MGTRHFSFARMLGDALGRGARAVCAPFGRDTGTRAIAHAASVLAPVITVAVPRGRLRFWCPSHSAAKRALKFAEAEPDTLEWIDAWVKPGEHLWDVGANVGAYTFYACLGRDVTVTAFDPVPATFAILVRNIELNDLDESVVALCLALSDTEAAVPLYLKSRDPGAAMHAITAPENANGCFRPERRLTTLALRGDDMIARGDVAAPDHIKIDVDGHELRVLEGLRGALCRARTVWIEMTGAGEGNGENARVDALLVGCGFAARELPSGQRGRNRLYVNTAAQTRAPVRTRTRAVEELEPIEG